MRERRKEKKQRREEGKCEIGERKRKKEEEKGKNERWIDINPLWGSFPEYPICGLFRK